MELNEHFNLLVQVILVEEGMKFVYVLQVIAIIATDGVWIGPQSTKLVNPLVSKLPRETAGMNALRPRATGRCWVSVSTGRGVCSLKAQRPLGIL
jgi:hypothetical protein